VTVTPRRSRLALGYESKKQVVYVYLITCVEYSARGRHRMPSGLVTPVLTKFRKGRSVVFFIDSDQNQRDVNSNRGVMWQSTTQHVDVNAGVSCARRAIICYLATITN